MNAHHVAFDVHLAAQPDQDVAHQRNIKDLRAVTQRGGAFGQKGCGHQLEHAVLGAVDANFARKPGAA